jgi:hypothetical protein
MQKIKVVTHKGLLSRINKSASIDTFNYCSPKLKRAIKLYAEYNPGIEIDTIHDIIKIDPNTLIRYRGIGATIVKELKEFQRAINSI